MTSTTSVRVAVRVRPPSSYGDGGTSGRADVVQVHKAASAITLGASPSSTSKNCSHQFTYDEVYDTRATQTEIYRGVGAGMLSSVFEGYNSTILAYGQTGSGKTFTMGSEAGQVACPTSSGLYASSSSEVDMASSSVGLIPRFMADLFRGIESASIPPEEAPGASGNSQPFHKFTVTASFLEVYGEDIHDLLALNHNNPPSLPIREDSNGVTVVGLSSKVIRSAEEALSVLQKGTMHRTTAATLMNKHSSRSHAVFTVTLTKELVTNIPNISDPSAADPTAPGASSTRTTVSKLTFVDLAGSERMKKTGAEGDRMKEGIQINVGLLALGNVINALGDTQVNASVEGSISRHVPYRQSKLTRLLQDALGGNSQTVFLACVSPLESNIGESLSTLKYANRARNIKNKPIKNIDPTVLELGRLEALGHGLRMELLRLKFFELKGQQIPKFLLTSGSEDDDFFKREEVKTYLKEVEEKAMSEFGKGLRSAGLMFGKSDGSNFLPVAFNIGQPLDSFRSDKLSFKGDLDAALINSSPDEDMAILDQLLELQQGENDYQKDQAKTENAINEVDEELDEQEKLLEKLRGSLQVYHTMKGKYEKLLNEVSSLEQEKGELAEQLAKVEVDPTRGCSKAIKLKLDKVEESLARARSESRKQQQMYKSAEREAQKARAMERKIEELKLGRVNLMKKQKETIARHRAFTENKTREIQTLKKKERKQGKNLTKLETECKKHKKALDRRTSYCHKITDKLKQTEVHLMRLLAMRKRELEKSNAARSKAGETGVHLGSKIHGSGRTKKSLSRLSFIQPPNWRGGAAGEGKDASSFAPKNQEVASLKFLLENYVIERIELAETREKYEATVEEYTALMRNLMEQMNKLGELKADCEGGLSVEAEADIVNHERNIEELELRLELVGVDMEELRGRLTGHLEEENGDNEVEGTVQDAATLKVVGDMVAPVARTLVLELMGTLTDSELQRRSLEKETKAKEAKLKDLEMKNNELSSKISQIAEASQFGSVHGAEGAFKIKSQLDEKERRLSETKEKLTMTELKFQSAGIELAECKEKLSVVDVSKEMKKETASTLAQLQTYWRLLGVDLEEREKVRNELESCVEEKCNALLRDATKRERETRQEIERLNELNASMQRALGRIDCDKSQNSPPSPPTTSTSKATDKRLSLLKQRELAQQIYTEIEPIFTKAKARHAKILENAKSLLGALEKGENSVSHTLRGFLGAQADKDGLFAEELLTRCEDELRKMRVMKSELLVKSNSAYERANKLATETHTSSDELLQLAKAFISKNRGKLDVADWWTEDICRQVCDFITISNMKVPTSSVWGKHLEIITKSVETIAEGREEFSKELKVVVEGAHQQLMSIIEGDDDAAEAYASFHSALFRLPRLSKEHIKACVNEIKILVGAADVMMQSETEALTVVWDALGLKEETRGSFWGECAESVKNYQEGKEGGPFDAVSLIGNNQDNSAEEWLMNLLQDAKNCERELRAKLYRLQLIHTEVEKKRTKQDAKSTIMSLDSEIRIIDAKLTQFEDKAGNKQRLVSKKTNSGVLLKEEKFRKHMQAKFISKLDKLRGTLKGWEARESVSFDLGLLSEEVRGLLGTGLGGAEDRTAFMHLRTVKSTLGAGNGGSKRRSTILGGGSKDGELVKEENHTGGEVMKLKRSNSDGNLNKRSDEEGEDSKPTESLGKHRVSNASIAAAIAEASAGLEALTSTGNGLIGRRKSRAESLAAYKSKKREARLSQVKERSGVLKDGKDNTLPGKELEAKRKTRTSTRRRQSVNPFGNVLTPTKENDEPPK
uniref:Kinesin motor domain-containing protein n=1 Tax=Triparma pacifica TaxID=91992 RepID=A0A7S2QVI8_9STRA|mmetsp:Transcript_1749/g.3425  ORF Transcript_1749/g.3425 Transcript_1749/m.3425 type:complete len:1799 (+) Transcript_1749:174-5570(+)